MNWKNIFKHLKDSGFDVYSIGQHEGDCNSAYIVLRNNGAQKFLSRIVQEYEILLYYPINSYSTFEQYIESVKGCMNKLYPTVKLIEDQQPHYPDADKKAYMTGIIYETQRISTVNRII